MVNPNWLYPKNRAEALHAQKEIAKLVNVDSQADIPYSVIAGMDVSNTPFDPQQMIYGAAVLIERTTTTVLETATIATKHTFPYISGLLGFREAPILVNIFQQLKIKPDVIFVDGHGISHPRRVGIASHLGVLLDIPTIGVAKSILVGAPQEKLPEAAGSMVPLLWKEQTIGMLLRSKKGCHPLIISAGHQITLAKAVELVMNCLRGYRLPEPTRFAHLAANVCRKEAKKRESHET